MKKNQFLIIENDEFQIIWVDFRFSIVKKRLQF